MILNSMDFGYFYDKVRNIFSRHFNEEQTNQLMEYVEILADANFRCYRANMIVIENRKSVKKDPNLISDMEWVARAVGEYRVSSKAKINQYISKVKTVKEVVEPSTWVSDDVVYSIGEMMDRLSIETIKREDFIRNNRERSVFKASENLSRRVEKYLIDKLIEIDEKGFYECNDEQRTYNLDGIKKDLAI